MKITKLFRRWGQVFGAAALAFLLTHVVVPDAQAQPKKPNIVIIWGDDIGQSDISAYSMGVMGFHTPNIDRVAKEGMIFTDSYMVGQFLATFKEYPQRQKAASFNLDEVLKNMQENSGGK
jgi:hypothetical protein